MKITVKNIKNIKVSEPCQINLMRGNSILANPYIMHNENERDSVCDKYAEWLDIQLKNNQNIKDEMNRLVKILREYNKLELIC